MMAESNDMLGQGCGCYIQAHGTWITYCPMHKAAPAMLAALAKAKPYLRKYINTCPDNYRGGAITVATAARDALAAARGQEVGA